MPALRQASRRRPALSLAVIELLPAAGGLARQLELLHGLHVQHLATPDKVTQAVGPPTCDGVEVHAVACDPLGVLVGQLVEGAVDLEDGLDCCEIKAKFGL